MSTLIPILLTEIVETCVPFYVSVSLQIDHFGFTLNKTFQQRYLVNTTFYKKGGPILIYTGNEAFIELFAQSAVRVISSSVFFSFTFAY